MHTRPGFLDIFERLIAGNERGLRTLAIYLVPAAITLFSVIALLNWDSQFPGSPPQTLSFQSTEGNPLVAEPGQALAALRSQPMAALRDTKTAETPFWLLLKAPEASSGAARTLEFPSRHATAVACWDAATLDLIGSADRQQAWGAMAPVKAGFALDLPPALQGHELVCRTTAVGPARLSAQSWDSASLLASNDEFQRRSGLLDGGIIVLALFILVTALVNRSVRYLLFSGWLVVNLRMAALSTGWDTQWLGHTVPYAWIHVMRLFTTALYYTMTISLFALLFKEDLSRIGRALPLRIVQLTCLPLVLCSLLLPYPQFLPILWIAAGIGSVVLLYELGWILKSNRSAVALWYSASIVMVLLGSVFEVIAAALGLQGLLGVINSVTAALASSLLTALAIAEQMRLEHAQWLEAQAKLAHTFKAMPIGVFSLDPQGRFLTFNPALARMLSPQAPMPAEAHWQTYFTAGAWTRLHHLVQDQVDAEIEVMGRPQTGTGAIRRYLVKATLANGLIEGSLQDVTDKAKAIDELRFLATHDPLTKVLNRSGIEQALIGHLAQAPAGATVALAYLDLDRFKLINDLYGLRAGDLVLQHVCQRVSHMLSGDLRIGRVGGDEFVIVFPDTPIATATVVCRGILERVTSQPYRIGDQALHVRASIGLIEVGADMLFNDALSTSDRACREAKLGHSGGLMVYEKNSAALQKHEAEVRLISVLATADVTLSLHLEMQPILSLTAPHESLNFEVLLRMRDSDGHPISTDRIISAGENSGQMCMIDRWVLSTTLAWLNDNHARIGLAKFVCINLSGASLNDEKFLNDVYEMLERNRKIVGMLCLEITESIALNDIENTRRFVNRVRSYGAKVALDDFGAGYTSFSYLKEFNADLLKIDGSFIVDMNKHPANAAIVEGIVSLARNLGMKVIAEWAEDQATLEVLAEMGVDYVQGFVVARSMHPDRILQAVSSVSLVRDDALLHYLNQIGEPTLVQARLDLFPEMQPGQIH